MKHFFPIFLLTFPTFCIGGNLTYVKTHARLPSPRSFSAGIFDGDDIIFLFGGHGHSGHMDEILKYTISTDSVELVGRLSSPGRFRNANALSINSAGIIHAFPTDPLQVVTSFNPATMETELVGNVSDLGDRTWRPFVQISDKKVALIGGVSSAFNNDIVLADLETLEISTYKIDVFQGDIRFSASAYNYELKTLYTAARNLTNNAYSILRYKFEAESENFEHVMDVPEFGEHSGAVWADGKMYVVDDYLTFGGDDEGVAVFDPVNLTYERLPVQGMNRTLENIRLRAVVYVEKLQRIYLFGGYQYEGNIAHDEIYYIDLGIPIPPTDAPTTSTPAPPLFSCSAKPDGFYPHPESCKGFIGCLGGDLLEYECPDALLFDPIELTCKHADDVICELSCVGRPNSVYPHPADCALFLTCHDDLGEVNKCPEPLLFDPFRLMCNFPHLVDCSNAA